MKLKNRLHSVTAEIVVPEGGASGVIVNQGGASAGAAISGGSELETRWWAAVDSNHLPPRCSGMSGVLLRAGAQRRRRVLSGAASAR